jgi:4-hydroxy-tetrahydrodipicolinate synthase
MQAADTRRPFGRLLTAMVTPMRPDGSVDLEGAGRLATYLVDEQGNDALVINGTTGEAPTTSNEEKESLIRAVVEAVGDRALVVGGVGTYDTHHTIELAKSAEKAGAHGLLVVTPYYSRPTQAGLLAHFRAVADATGLPLLVYDIPVRSAVAVETETMCRLAEHPRIVGVKDAKGNLNESSWVLRRTDLAYYSGDDPYTLPLLSVGGVGVIGTSTHFTGLGTKELIEAFERGDTARALALHQQLLPLYTGIFRVPGQGVILVKAGLNLKGLPGGTVRSPVVEATPEQIEQLRRDAAEAGLPL